MAVVHGKNLGKNQSGEDVGKLKGELQVHAMSATPSTAACSFTAPDHSFPV